MSYLDNLRDGKYRDEHDGSEGDEEPERVGPFGIFVTVVGGSFSPGVTDEHRNQDEDQGQRRNHDPAVLPDDAGPVREQKKK